MKKIIFSLLVLVLAILPARSAYAQKITYKGKAVKLEVIFISIQQQTLYDFLYNDSLMFNAKPVDIDVDQAPLQEVLEICSANQDFFLVVIGTSITMKPKPLPAQGNSEKPPPGWLIKGYVVNEKGEPLSRATVLVQNSRPVATTGDKGDFSVRVNDRNARLEISYVGYENKIIDLDGASLVRILMKPVKKIMDTVYTGIEDIPRERATGSFSKVSVPVLGQSVKANILERLVGVVSGFLPHSTWKKTDMPLYTVRGVSTIFARHDPLIVVDSHIYDGDINNINPDNIESVTVLKDAVAESWGSRSGNGVIVITTRRGHYDQKMSVSVNMSETISFKSGLHERPSLSSSDFIDIESSLFRMGFYDNDLKKPWPVVSPSVEVFNLRKRGLISPADSAFRINELKKVDLNRELMKYVFRTSKLQQYSLGINGGSANAYYSLFVAYNKNQAFVPGEETARFNFNLKTTVKLNKKLEMSSGVLYSKTRASHTDLDDLLNPGNDGKSNPLPYTRLADDYGNPLPVVKGYRNSFTDTAGNNQFFDWKLRPLNELTSNSNETTSDDILLNLSVKYIIGSWLYITGNYQFEKTWTDNRILHGETSFFTNDLVNTFTLPGEQASYNTIPQGGILIAQQDNLLSHTFRSQLNGHWSWGEHEMNAIAGVEIKRLNTDSNSYRIYGYNEEGLTHGSISNQSLPTYFGIYSEIPNPVTISKKVDKFASLYGNLSERFKNRYTLTASLRKDGSNLYGVRTNRKFSPFYAVGVAWEVSKELFYTNTWLPFLNLRFTYGRAGNTKNDITGTLTVREGFPNPANTFPVYEKANAPNKDLRWEDVGLMNIGIDFRSADKRISGSVEFYRKYCKRILSITRGYPTSGFDNFWANDGQMRGTGIDIELNSILIDKKFKWQLLVLASYNTIKITSYPVNLDSVYMLAGSTGSLIPIVGQHPWSITSYRAGQLDPLTGGPRVYANGYLTGDPNFVRSNLTPADLVTGPVMPRLFGSVRNLFTFQSFSLMFNVSYRLFYFVRRDAIDYYGLAYAWNRFDGGDYSLRWRQPGDELHTGTPAMIYPLDSRRDNLYVGSDQTMTNAGNIRLEDINLGYSIEKKKKKRMPFQAATIYLVMGNVCILWKAAKIPDPDFGVPQPRTISMGIKMTL